MATEQRLIDANAFLQKLSKMIDYCKTDNKVNALTALFQVGDAVMDCPTVDAVPVVHGRWLRGDEMPDYPRVLYISDKHYCSECRNEAHEEYDGYDYSEILSDYCPNCGAKMDGERRTDNG